MLLKDASCRFCGRGCAGPSFRCVAPLVSERGLLQMRLGLGCPMACGVLVPQLGLEPCPLRRKVDS